MPSAWGFLAQLGWEEGREAPGRALGASRGAQGTSTLQLRTGTGLLVVIHSPNDTAWGTDPGLQGMSELGHQAKPPVAQGSEGRAMAGT